MMAEDRDMSIGHPPPTLGVGDDDENAPAIPLDDEDEEKNGAVHKLPSFKWDDEYSTTHARLIVTFPDKTTDTALLSAWNPIPNAPDDEDMDEPDQCIFKGNLREDTEVAVNVNGCPGEYNFDVRFIFQV